MEIIDAYTHCGISKYEPIESVRRVMESAGVRRAVLVQHLGEFDNSYIGSCVASNPDQFAGVGLVDHSAPDAAKRLSQLAEAGHFSGIRFPVQVLIDAPELFDQAAELGLIIVLFAPDGLGHVIDPLRRFLDAHPDAELVLTHLATPRIEEAPTFAGARAAFALANYPGVYWQLSGMKMYCPWPHAGLYTLIENAVGALGSERILWGSNYPVVGSELDYRNDLELLTSGRLPIVADAIPLIAGANARRLWFQSAEKLDESHNS